MGTAWCEFNVLAGVHARDDVPSPKRVEAPDLVAAGVGVDAPVPCEVATGLLGVARPSAVLPSVRPDEAAAPMQTHPRRHHQLPHVNHAPLVLRDWRRVGDQTWVGGRSIVGRGDTPRILETLDGRVLFHPYLMCVERQGAHQVEQAGTVVVGDEDVVEALDCVRLALDIASIALRLQR